MAPRVKPPGPLMEGRAQRTQVPRSSHAIWVPPADRSDPVSLLEASNRSRIAALVPFRYQRMLTSPFAFLRGSVAVMAADLATTPVTGVQVQMCGDAHLNNFGTYATPERNQIFDVNDFDETWPGPWEWDVKRLAASVVVVGRQNGFSAASTTQAVLGCMRTYRERMWEFGDMDHIEVWYARVDAQRILKQVGHAQRPFLTCEIEEAHQHTSNKVFPRLTQKNHGHVTITDHPPFITHLPDDECARWVEALLEGYEASLSDDKRVLLQRYRVVDLAQKVGGIGSVGMHCYIALLLGSEHGNPLFLQLKEAQPSVWERYLPCKTSLNQAQRVINGQRLMQAASDIFLGWTSNGPVNCSLRQLYDRKETPNIEQLSEGDFILYAELCGWTLARAHARSGDPALISGYIGKSISFERAIAAFAQAYADQTERDYTALVKAAHTGRVSFSR